ncbi:MAG: PEGA domain-containing protein [Vicinamibacterales bacterium]
MKRSTLVRLAIEIDSSPSGAVVMLDGNRIGTAPTTVTFEGAAASQSHDMSLITQDDEHETTNHSFVPSNLANRSLVVELVRRPAAPSLTPAPPVAGSAPRRILPAPSVAVARSVLVIRAPQEVDVRLDGQSLGRGDAFRIDVSPGNHRVEFVDEGLFVPAQDVMVQAGATQSVVLGALASIRLAARPGNSEVWVGDRRMGVTPLTFTAPEGVYQLQFRWPDGRSLSYPLPLRTGMSPFLAVAPGR